MNRRFLKNGDRVVLFGDSITHGGFYGEYLELFFATRHPDLDVRFSNSGWSGASLEQGLWSVADDVAAKKPTVVTVMFGMNDVDRYAWPRVGDTPALAERRAAALAAFDSRMDELARRIRAEAGNPEIVYFTPTPYDQTCIDGGAPSPLVCDDGLAELARRIRARAAREGARCVDLHAALLAVNAAMQSSDPEASILRRAPGAPFDRVHPGPAGHVVILHEILKAFGEAGAVDEIVRDAAGADALSFSCTEKALPFPMTAEMGLALPFVPFGRDFNREILRVANLEPGREYAVRIDGVEVGAWPVGELAAGIDLASVARTPQRRQAEEAADICRRIWGGERTLRDLATSRRWARRHYGLDPDAPGTFETLIERLLAAGTAEDSYDVQKYRGYLKNWPRRAEIAASMESDRAALAEAARPAERHFEIRKQSLDNHGKRG